MSKKSKALDFAIPTGFTPPEGSAPGDSFEAVATFYLGKDGSLCLKAVDGIPLSNEKEDDDKEAEVFQEKSAPEAGMSFQQAVQEGMA